jgi:hypothetical protein
VSCERPCEWRWISTERWWGFNWPIPRISISRRLGFLLVGTWAYGRRWPVADGAFTREITPSYEVIMGINRFNELAKVNSMSIALGESQRRGHAAVACVARLRVGSVHTG